MTTKASTVVMSHISDLQELINFDYPGVKKEMNTKADFAKFVIIKTAGDLNKEIDPDAMFAEYVEWRNA